MSRPPKALSPFTWNNLALPPIAKLFQPQIKSQSQQQRLDTIVEGHKKKKKILSGSIELNTKSIDSNMETLPSKSIAKPRRYTKKSP